MPGTAWLILPTYNEIDNLEGIVAAVRTAVPEARLLVVDDASPDGTGLLADRLAARHSEVEVLHRLPKGGLGAAYVEAFTAALRDGAELVLGMDADFSHDPADLGRLVARAREGADVVLGSRYVAGGSIASWSPPRRAVSRAGCWYARTVLGVEVRDLTGGFRCFRRAALEAIDLPGVRSRGYAFQVEVVHRAIRQGLSVVEIPIVFHERRSGTSKMSARIALEAAWRVPLMRLQGVRARAR